MEQDAQGSSGVDSDEPSSPVANPGEDEQPSPSRSPPKKKHKKTKREGKADKKKNDRERLEAKRAVAKEEGGVMEDPSHVMKAGEAVRIAKLNETKKVQKSMEKKQAVQRAFRSRQERHQTVSDLHDEIHEMSRITTRLRLQRRQLCDEKGAPLKELEAEALHLTQLI
jgi:hypothetical protein